MTVCLPEVGAGLASGSVQTDSRRLAPFSNTTLQKHHVHAISFDRAGAQRSAAPVNAYFQAQVVATYVCMQSTMLLTAATATPSAPITPHAACPAVQFTVLYPHTSKASGGS